MDYPDHPSPNLHQDVHESSSNSTPPEKILAPFEGSPQYCDYAGWEVPECVDYVHSWEAIEHSHTRMNTVVVIALVVVGISIAFESVSKKLHAVAGERGSCSLQVVEALTQEIMSVGFIVLVSTIFIQTGTMRLVSDMAFSRETTEYSFTTGQILQGFPATEVPHDVRHGHQISELTVMFQDIHFFISCVVMSLALMGLLGLYNESWIAKRWKEAEGLVSEFGSDHLAYAHLLAKRDSVSLQEQMEINRKLVYLGFRSEFLTPHEGLPPPHVNPAHFDFYKYVHRNMGESIVASFQGPKYLYVCFFAISLVFMPLFGMTSFDHVRFFVVSAWVLFACFAIILQKLLWIEDQLMPTESCMKAKTSGVKLLVGLSAKYRSRVQTGASSSCHEGLFWFGHRGPKFMMMLLQFLSMAVGIFIATLLHNIENNPYTWEKYGMYSLPLIFPPLLLVIFVLFPESLTCLVFTTTTEQLPNHKAIRAVNQEYAEGKSRLWSTVVKAIKRERIRYKVREAVKNGELAQIEMEFEELSTAQKVHYMHCFEAYDIKSKGGLSRDELVACLLEIQPDDTECTRKRKSKRMYAEDAVAYMTEEAKMQRLRQDVDDWFRIFEYPLSDAVGEQVFKCLVVSLLSSTDEVLKERDVIPVLARHSGLQLEKQHEADAIVASHSLEVMLHSISQMKLEFRAAGRELVQDILRTEGGVRRVGKGWKAIVRMVREEPRVTINAIAKYIVRVDVVAQSSANRLQKAMKKRRTRTEFARSMTELSKSPLTPPA